MRSACVRPLLLLVLAACWRSVPERAPAPSHAAAAREPFPLRSQWRGIYRCSQGVTAVVLDLVATREGALAATFTFGPTADNPEVPHGVYRLAGTIRAFAEGTFRIALAPERWIGEAPPGYTMISLSATSSRRWRRLVGKIDHPACSELDLQRVLSEGRGT